MDPLVRKALLARSTPRIVEPYFPHVPHRGPQHLFLCLDDVLEVFYGGAAGGGKSDALLMAALQYVNVPGYSALLLRKTWGDLTQPGAIMDRAHEWLSPTPAKSVGGGRTWRFPSGARLVFGYVMYHRDVEQYASAEYQFIGIDELSRGWEKRTYEFLFSRLRKPKDPSRLGRADDGMTLADVPLRMRTSSNPGGCVPYGDVLTPRGWRPIEDFRSGDPVFTVTREGVLTETTVSRVFRYDWSDDLVEVRARGLRMVITPDHRVAKVTPDGFALTPFESLPGQATVLRTVAWEGEELSLVTPPRLPGRRRKLRQPESLPGPLFCALLGWLLSEGCLVDRDKAFSIAQMKPEGRRLVASLLDECGFSYSVSDRSFTVCAPDWWSYLRDLGVGLGCRDKRVPAWVKSASRSELGAFFSALMAGDGHWQSADGGTYYTTSRQLADDVAEVALKLGYVVSASSRQRVGRRGLAHEICVKRTKSGGTELLTGQHVYAVETTTKRRSDVKKTAYRGPVYCLGVDGTETFVLRQHGSVWVSGNSGHSWVKELFVEPSTRRDGAVFVPASLKDNPTLNQEEYTKSLEHLGPVERERMLRGDWTVIEEGAMFSRYDFEVVDEPPAGIEWVRYWDLASTEVKTGRGAGDPDWTAGALLGQREGVWYLGDVVHMRGTPLQVEQTVAQTAATDGRRVRVFMEQEGGASGVNTIDHYRRLVLPGYAFSADRPSGSKPERARPMASAVAAGNFKLVRGAWNRGFLDEAETFPVAGHDDQIDAASGAMTVQSGGRGRARILV